MSLTFTGELKSQHQKLQINSLLVTSQNGWNFVVFPLQSYGLKYNFTFRAIDLYVSIWVMFKNNPSCAKEVFCVNLTLSHCFNLNVKKKPSIETNRDLTFWVFLKVICPN